MAGGADGAGGGVAVRMRMRGVVWVGLLALSVLRGEASEIRSGMPPLYSQVRGGRWIGWMYCGRSIRSE